MKSILEQIKNFLISKSSFVNYIFSAAIALILCILIYHFCYPFFTYSNLNDFYVGTSIFENHNKSLDLGMFFVYVIIFYIVFWANKINLKLSLFKNVKINKFKSILNIILSLLFIAFSCYMIKNNLFNISLQDPHHYGEKFATYYQHSEFGLKYYKDIMLVHGYIDILPSWFADNIIGELTFQNERLSLNLILLLLCIPNLIMTFFIYKKDWAMALISSGVLYYLVAGNSMHNLTTGNSTHSITFGLCFLILLHFYKSNSVFWFSFFYLSSLFMLSYHTTCGTACFVASLPLLIYKIKNNPKNGTVFIILSTVLTYFIAGEEITSYLNIAKYYAVSNLYSFGTSFAKFIPLNVFIFNMFAFLAFPFFVNKFVTSKDKKVFFASLYAIILILMVLNYSFGRLDANIPRASYISAIIIMVILPYIYYNSADKYKLKLILCIIILLQFTPKIPNNPSVCFLYDNVSYVYKTSLNSSYLDLTNHGMNYYFTKRKAAIPYTSYYNVVNSEQTNEILQRLKLNPPEAVLIWSSNAMSFDRTSVPLRINSVYKWLYTSKNYEQIEEKDRIYLHYSPGSIITKEQALNADKYIWQSNLYQLPDVWGASVNSLPLAQINNESNINEGKIVFNNITPYDADLLYIEYESSKPLNFELKLNELTSVLQFYSKKGQILIPLDNYPSWLMEENLNTFALTADNEFKIKRACLYKRQK